MKGATGVRQRLLVLLVVTAVTGSVLTAQPTPRLPDGKTDFGGKGVWAPIWVQDWADTKYVDKAVDVPFTPWGLATFQERRANLPNDHPESYSLPPPPPRSTRPPS